MKLENKKILEKKNFVIISSWNVQNSYFKKHHHAIFYQPFSFNMLKHCVQLIKITWWIMTYIDQILSLRKVKFGILIYQAFLFTKLNQKNKYINQKRWICRIVYAVKRTTTKQFIKSRFIKFRTSRNRNIECRIHDEN